MCVCKLGPTNKLSNFLKTEITVTWGVTKHGPAMIYVVRCFEKVCVYKAFSFTNNYFSLYYLLFLSLKSLEALFVPK
jgi:hypothetical protein